MSKNVAVFIDVANLYYSARGQDVDVDYVALLKAATKGRDLVRAYAYSGLDPENENQRKFLDFLGKNGYKVVHKDIRKFGDGRVKANLDIELVVDLFRVRDRMDIAVIVSGDGDFAPAIRALQDVGVRCEVISFRPNTSSDLIAVADEFTDIMKIASIGREKMASKGMSAPPMPAKEVEPDVSFREASPAVAAAALAAIKGGSSTGRGRGRAPASGGGTGRRRHESSQVVEETSAAHATTDQPTAAEHVTAVVDHADNGHENGDGEAHRRRRRRGGRGRGRRGHGEESTEPTSPAGEALEEIGWQEIDDLSQLGDLGAEREYAFEEADAATLAELGLSAPADGAAGEAQPAASRERPAPKPRRSRSVKAETDAAEQPAKQQGEDEKPAPKPRQRRTPTAKADATPGAEAPASDAQEGESAAPKRRGRPRKAVATPGEDAPAAASGSPAGERGRARKAQPQTTGDEANARGDEARAQGGEEPQGIWQRFRSARSTR